MKCHLCNRYLKSKEDEARHNRIFHTKLLIVLVASVLFLSGCHGFEAGHGVDKFLNGGQTYSEAQKEYAPHSFVACCKGDGGFCQEIIAAGGTLFVEGTWYDAICGMEVPHV